MSISENNITAIVGISLEIVTVSCTDTEGEPHRERERERESGRLKIRLQHGSKQMPMPMMFYRDSSFDVFVFVLSIESNATRDLVRHSHATLLGRSARFHSTDSLCVICVLFVIVDD
jgi:hypothetical protein